MKDNRDLEETRSKPVVDPVRQGGPQKMDEGRRRFAKGALTVPVIFTLTGRPVWARLNCTESGVMSGNMSDAESGDGCGGEGCSTAFWARNTEQWHRDYQPTDLFNQVFGVDAFPNATLHQVITGDLLPSNINVPSACVDAELSCTDVLKGLGSQSVAALQNAATSVSYDLTVNVVINSFVDAYTNGTIEAMQETMTSLNTLNSQICPLS